jgi:hypothetical protein
VEGRKGRWWPCSSEVWPDELRRARRLEAASAWLDGGAPPVLLHPSVKLVELPLELVEPKLE